MQGNGFVFWGLPVVLGAIVAAYTAWMFWAERSGARNDPESVVPARAELDSNRGVEGEDH